MDIKIDGYKDRLLIDEYIDKWIQRQIDIKIDGYKDRWI